MSPKIPKGRIFGPGTVHPESLTRKSATLSRRRVVELAVEQPTWGQVRIANELRRRGLGISPAGVRSVWLRQDLASTK
jgi:hypothetical protein